jgi:hypothetical protein
MEIFRDQGQRRVSLEINMVEAYQKSAVDGWGIYYVFMGKSSGNSAFGRNNNAASYGKKRVPKRLGEFLLRC